MGTETNGSRRFEDAAALRKACDAYFSQCDSDGVLYGEAGLALALGVTLNCLRSWYDGKKCPDLQSEVQMAYLRIQNQIETDPAYMEKGGMTSKAIFLLKQARLGGYQDKIESRQDMTVHVKMGDGVDAADFK